MSRIQQGIVRVEWVNTLRPRQNGWHFADGISKCIFLNEDLWISINISLKFVPRGQIHNLPALIEIMAWRRSGNKPLSEPMMVRLPTHLCVTWPQRVKWKRIIAFSCTAEYRVPGSHISSVKHENCCHCWLHTVQQHHISTVIMGLRESCGYGNNNNHLWTKSMDWC